MSLCINPRCPQPQHPENSSRPNCAACGSSLLVQGRYRVMRLISHQSGFGRVYEVYDGHVPKILKVLKESYNQNPKVVELFRREAQVLSRLRHPGVPRVDANGYFHYFPKDSTDPSHCLVMEKIDGPNLKQWMVQQGNHPISQQQAILWLTQLTDVLHLVHQQNYFHRDIKPENIMLRSSGQLVLVDFGAAREMTQTYLAQLGDSGITTVSSAGYTPPEQEQGQAVPQSDFYAMGRTLIYLLTAKLPNDPSIYDSRSNQFSWRQYAPQISADLAALIDQLTAPASVNRPQSTAVILERLAQLRSHPTPAIAPPPQIPVAPAWPATTLNPQISRPFSRPWWLAACGALAVALPLAGYGLQRLGLLRLPGLVRSPITEVSVTAKGTLVGHQGEIKDLLLLNDGQTLITAGTDRALRLWNLSSGQLIRTLGQHTNVVKALAVTTDQTLLISTGDDRTIRFWDLPSGQLRGQIDNAHPVPINALTVSNDNRRLASADGGGLIKLWPLGPAPQPSTMVAGHHSWQAEGTVNDLRFGRDDGFVVSGGKSLQLWPLANLDKGANPIPRTFPGHTSFINQLAVSEDNQTLITASADKTIGLWQIASGSRQAVLEGHQSYVNSLRIEGAYLWSADQAGTLLVWDLQQQRPLRRVRGFDRDIWRFVLQPPATLITIGGDQAQVYLWQLPTLSP
ncbi:MAG: serine/threonine-protein kinase [Cyanobacteriota bacterium]|nr:serine/threonine-protein kinase [Cyanobacteriota bacterium]